MKMKHVTLIAMMAMFSDFVSAGESAAPVFDMIAENVIIIINGYSLICKISRVYNEFTRIIIGRLNKIYFSNMMRC